MCELCNQRVMLREMAAHRLMNCSIAKPDSVDVRPKEANVKPKTVYDNGELNYGLVRRGVDSRFMFAPLPKPVEEKASSIGGKATPRSED